MKLLIGICGRAQHGKDTVAEAMSNWFIENNISSYQTSVSQTITHHAFQRGLISQSERNRCSPEELQVLVRLGVEEAGLWVKRAMLLADSLPFDVVILTGRFVHNEVEDLRRYYAVLVKVLRLNEIDEVYLSSDRDPKLFLEESQDSLRSDYVLLAHSGDVHRLVQQAHTLASCLRNRF